MKKKGVATIVVTVILVALVLIALGLMWGVISKLILKSSKEITIEKLTVDVDIKGAKINEVANNISVTLRRNPGVGNLVGFKFVFKNESYGEVKTINSTLTELEEKTFIFNLGMNVSDVKIISLVLLIRPDTKEISGSVIEKYDVETGDYSL